MIHITQRLVLLFTCCLLFVYGCALNGSFVNSKFDENVPVPNDNEIIHSLFFLGDAGESRIAKREPTFLSLDSVLSIRPEKSSLIYLGDNVYPNGLMPKGNEQRHIGYYYLIEQIKVGLHSGAETYFIPGNHDWENGSDKGLEILKNQIEVIDSVNKPNIHFLPKAGCPGPIVVDLSEKIRIVIIDTQWILNSVDLRKKTPDDCSCKTTKQLMIELKNIMNSSADKNVILAMHHPLDSNGEHGGFFDWKAHLFPLREINSYLWIPLPVIGSLFPLSRNLGATVQDISNGKYADMIAQIKGAIKENPPIAVISGHDHVLQVLEAKDLSSYYLIPGKGTPNHDDVVTDGENTIFANSESGYMRIDFLKNGKIRLGVISATDKKNPYEIFSLFLKN